MHSQIPLLSLPQNTPTPVAPVPPQDHAARLSQPVVGKVEGASFAQVFAADPTKIVAALPVQTAELDSDSEEPAPDTKQGKESSSHPEHSDPKEPSPDSEELLRPVKHAPPAHPERATIDEPALTSIEDGQDETTPERSFESPDPILRSAPASIKDDQTLAQPSGRETAGKDPIPLPVFQRAYVPAPIAPVQPPIQATIDTAPVSAKGTTPPVQADPLQPVKVVTIAPALSATTDSAPITAQHPVDAALPIGAQLPVKTAALVEVTPTKETPPVAKESNQPIGSVPAPSNNTVHSVAAPPFHSTRPTQDAVALPPKPAQAGPVAAQSGTPIEVRAPRDQQATQPVPSPQHRGSVVSQQQAPPPPPLTKPGTAVPSRAEQVVPAPLPAPVASKAAAADTAPLPQQPVFESARATPPAAQSVPASGLVITPVQVQDGRAKDTRRTEREPLLPAPLASPRVATRPAAPIAMTKQAAPLVQWANNAPLVNDQIVVNDLIATDPITGEPRLSPTAAATTAPGVSARPDLPPTLARQLAEAVQHMPKRPVEISLKPQELGAVRMTVQQADTGIVVNLTAERPETLELMRRNIDQLGQDFQALGYTNIAFSFAGSEADTNSEGSGDGSHRQQFAAADDQIPTDSPTEIHLSTGTSSGVDLRL